VGAVDVRNSVSAQKLISQKVLAERGNQSVGVSLEGRRFEQFIQELSASFVRSPVDEIAGEIDHWIREIVLGLNLDRGALAQIDAKSGKLTVRHCWGRDRLVKLPIGLELARAPWFDETLMKGRTVVFSSVKELPPEFLANDWTTSFRRYVPKSNVTAPIRIGGEVIGALGFASLTKERSWSARLVRRLEMVAAIFGNALERRLAAEQNALLREELSHMSRTAAMGELTASLTHQLNQPIGAILMNAEEIQRMLESGQPNLEDLNDAVSDIIKDDLRATETIRGLRSFFRKSEVERAPLYVGDVVAEVVRMVRSDSLLRNVSLTFDAPAPPMRVAGDRIQLQQVILNLVLNAFDAVSDREDLREVSISMSVYKDQVRVAVRDTGEGIDAVAMPQIFEPFFTTKARGMGMGLTIARSIVKAHGGQISARRNLDRGSTFEIVLPALQENI
jgi:signal transduction histidine kinase